LANVVIAWPPRLHGASSTRCAMGIDRCLRISRNSEQDSQLASHSPPAGPEGDSVVGVSVVGACVVGFSVVGSVCVQSLVVYLVVV